MTYLHDVEAPSLGNHEYIPIWVEGSGSPRDGGFSELGLVAVYLNGWAFPENSQVRGPDIV